MNPAIVFLVSLAVGLISITSYYAGKNEGSNGDNWQYRSITVFIWLIIFCAAMASIVKMISISLKG